VQIIHTIIFADLATALIDCLYPSLPLSDVVNPADASRDASRVVRTTSDRIFTMSRVGRFVQKKDVDTRNSQFGNEKAVTDSGAAEQQRRMNDLRVKVPVTRLEAKPESHLNVSSMPILDKALQLDISLFRPRFLIREGTPQRRNLLTFTSRGVNLMIRSLKTAQSVPSTALHTASCMSSPTLTTAFHLSRLPQASHYIMASSMVKVITLVKLMETTPL